MTNTTTKQLKIGKFHMKNPDLGLLKSKDLDTLDLYSPRAGVN